MKKKVLVISYTFHPSNQIGGRRWTKFVRLFLKHHEIDVKVITSKYNKGEVTENEIPYSSIEKISFNDFRYLGVIPRTFLEKILYRLSLILSKFKTKFNYYDKAVHGRKNLLYKTEKLINDGYNNVIVTVAPFHLARIISEIIHKYPKVNFIVDFRDPWVYNETAYGYNSLSFKRKRLEQWAEEKVVNSFDFVVTVSDKLTNILKSRYPSSISNFITIHNGFDKEDIWEGEQVKSKKIKLIFAGNLYNNVKKYILHFKNSLEHIRVNDKDLFDKIEISFYGPNTYENFDLHNCIKKQNNLNLREIHKNLNNADIGLLFLSDDINYSFSTKFCEYVAYKLHIIVFSSQGYTYDFIENNEIGYGISIDDGIDKLLHAIRSIFINKDKFYSKFNRDRFNLEYLSKSYVNLLK